MGVVWWYGASRCGWWWLACRQSWWWRERQSCCCSPPASQTCSTKHYPPKTRCIGRNLIIWNVLCKTFLHTDMLYSLSYLCYIGFAIRAIHLYCTIRHVCWLGLVWFGFQNYQTLYCTGAGAAAGSLDVIRVVPHLALASNMLMVAGWGLPPPPDHQSLALSCLHSNFKGWMVWIESGVGSESKTKPIVAGLGLFTISGSPPSFWRIRQTFNSAGACDYEVQQIEDAKSFLRF